MPRLAQTLHGYDQGHRLLAATEGLLDARELALLDRLSDLSGYLPSGITFDRYHTGFPCGRYYALASTWLDTAATRAGTVLTHTLLLPLQEARTLENLWALTAHHRKPLRAEERELYTRPLEVDLHHRTPGAEPKPEEREGLVALTFGQAQRPLLWVDARRPEGAVHYLWSLLWPEQREHFAFCTLALQLRAVEGRNFDFLGLPPEARGSFLPFAGNEAWWDNDRVVHSRLQGLPQQPWAQDVVRGGPATTRRLVEWCRAQSLGLPQPWEIPVLWRFLDLEPAASERLAAARSRADLFERLWPQLDPLHPCATRVLEDLLAHQPDAALKPRPFWELVDLLKRKLLRRRCETDPAFAARVEGVRATEITARLRQEPVLAAAGLPELIEASSATAWNSRSVSAIQEAVRGAAEPVPIALHLLEASATHGWQDIAEAVLESLPESNRNEVLDEALQAASGQQQLLSFIWQLAEKLRDPAFALGVALRRGEPVEGIKVAMRLLLAREPSPRDDQLEALLDRVDPSARLEWALEETEARLVSQAAEIIGRELRVANLPPAEVLKFCEGRPNGSRVLAVWVAELGRAKDTAQLLREDPRLAKELVLLMLQGERLPHHEALARQALEALRSEQLLTPEVLEMLRTTRQRSTARMVVSRLGPYWVHEAVETTAPPESLTPWLERSELRDWLQDASAGQLFYALGPSARSTGLPRIASVLHAWLRQTSSPDAGWLAPVLRHFLEGASAFHLEDATPDLVPLLRQALPRFEGQHLAMHILNIMSVTPTPSGWRLVEFAFPYIYPRLVRNPPTWIKQAVRVFTSAFTGTKDKDWDKAGPLRWWLIDTYVRQSWPPGSLLRCLDGNEPLFRRLVYRAARSSLGLEFLRTLPHALASEPELARRWRHAVEDALADPSRPVDYE